MPRPDDPLAAPAGPATIPDRRRLIGLAAGIALTLVAIGVAVAFGLSGDDDPGRIVTAVTVAQDGEGEDPAPAPPSDAAGGAGFAAFAAAGGWTPLNSRTDEVDGRAVTTVFWGRGGRLVAHAVLPDGPVPPPQEARRTGRRGVLLYSFDAGPRTAVTWTENDRTSVISSIGVGRAGLYDLAGGPPRRP